MPKVSGFTDAAGVQHLPGEIVELPESYKGETWLKPVELDSKVKVSFEKPNMPEVPAIHDEVFQPEKKPRRKAKQ